MVILRAVGFGWQLGGIAGLAPAAEGIGFYANYRKAAGSSHRFALIAAGSIPRPEGLWLATRDYCSVS